MGDSSSLYTDSVHPEFCHFVRVPNAASLVNMVQNQKRVLHSNMAYYMVHTY